MAEINLLKTASVTRSPWQIISGLIIKVLMVIALGVVVFYLYLYFRIKSVNSEIGSTVDQTVKAKNEALALPGREEFLVRQAQLKEYTSLTASHPYFSKLLPALAKATLKKAYYTGVTVSTDGKLSLSVVVPDLYELDKFLQVFNQPEVYKYFYNVRLGGFSKTETNEGQKYRFQVELDYNGVILSEAFKPN